MDAAYSLLDSGSRDAAEELDAAAHDVDASQAPDGGEPPDAAEVPDAADLPDVGIEPDGGAEVDAGPPTCDLGTAASFATDQALNLFGQVVYFNGGNALPAGPYRITYLDGCMKYGNGQGWTIHAYSNGSIAWWLVGASTTDMVLMPPGTVGWSPTGGAFNDFDDCVAANLALPPLEFDFAGGPLGVWLRDSPYTDNQSGVDGRNPKWQLTQLSACDGGVSSAPQ
ncbi:MAG: hypothetical protein HY901_22925 [Deltaproteobacteria bacterium]|nr:hypothetical protein [Deltaproteobacteria bacterium]